MDCWQCLQIEPTNDLRTIKRAYAKLIKQYSPETDPNAFQIIRQAFEDAKKQAAFIDDFPISARVESNLVKIGESSSVEPCKDAIQPEVFQEETIQAETIQEETIQSEIQPEIIEPEVAMVSLSDSSYVHSSSNTVEDSDSIAGDSDNKADVVNAELSPMIESKDVSLDSAISTFQTEFWLRFEALLNNTEIKLEQWQSLLNSDLMHNIEIKQILHYQVFESLVQVISKAEQKEKLALNQQVIRLLTDTFGWRDNELALANVYGYDGVSLVMDFDGPMGTNRQRVLDEISQEAGFFKKTIFPALSWIVLLGILYFAISMMNAKRESSAQKNNDYNSSHSNYQNNTKEEFSQNYIIESCRRLFDINAIPMAIEELYALCLQFAEQQQDEYAALYIGSAKFLSSTLPLDLELALSWLQKSADQGNEQATFWLGVLLAESGNRLKHDEDSSVVLSSAHYMGSRLARPYLYSMNLSQNVDEGNLDAFHLAVKSNQHELGHIAIIAHIYYRFILTHRQSAIPQYDLNDQSVREILYEFDPIISEGTTLERSRLLHLILAYTRPYEYDTELQQIAGSFISDTHNYQDIETYLWVAAFKAYTMDFGGANAVIDMAKIKLQQSLAYFEPDYKLYLIETMLKQQAAYQVMETVHIPLGDANIRQLAREMMVRTKQLAIKQLVEG